MRRRDTGHMKTKLLFLMLFCLLAAPSSAFASFGIASLSITATEEDGTLDFQAGSHPFAYSFEFAMNTDSEGLPEGGLRGVAVDLPPGLVGDPGAVPSCSRAEFGGTPRCASSSQVGLVEASVIGIGTVALPLYNLAPPPGYVASFGGSAAGNSFVELLSVAGSGSSAHLRVTVPILPLGSSIVRVAQTLWGVPADPGHDAERGECLSRGGSCPGTVAPAALITLPVHCGDSPTTAVTVSPFEAPGQSITTKAELLGPGNEPQGLIGCDARSFVPTLALGTGGDALSPSALKLELGLAPSEQPYGSGAAQLRELTLDLPFGLAINPAASFGLEGCPPAQIGLESEPGQDARFDSAAAACPGGSKIGTITADLPALGEVLSGTVYLAAPGQNPYATMFALYLVLEDPARGLAIKIPARLDADPETGRLTAAITDLPEFPFTDIDLEFPSGPRALFVTPPTCGRYVSTGDLVPSTAPEGLTAHVESGFTLTTGPGGTCPPPESGRPVPSSFEAGAGSPIAGSSSSFILRLTRADLDQHFGSFELNLPPGLVANLGATPLGTEVGSAAVEAGVGPEPLLLDGKVYLRGPYKGSPYSLEIVVPAQAGPFDLGTITERVAVDVDAATAQISARADPLPQILEGAPLQLRGLRIYLDRPGFIRNPTSCEPMAMAGSATTSLGQVAPLSARFQVGDCAALALKPKISLSLSGISHRGAHPGVRVTVRPRPGDANLSEATITLPPTELLDTRHVKAVCPAGRFAAGSCPKGSLVGHVEVWTPLLGRPLAGDIYLRSSAGRLPVLAVSLEGEVQATFVAKVDSVHQRIRLRLGGIPDVPLEKVAIDLFGGKHGVIADTGGICAGKPRAKVILAAQNGRTDSLEPRLRTHCGSG